MNLPLVKALRTRLGAENVLSAKSDLVVYECDGFTIEKNRPEVVVFPRSTRQVAAVVKLCNQHGVAVVPRGAGTSLAGGCLPVGGGAVVMLTRMKQIMTLSTDYQCLSVSGYHDLFPLLEIRLPPQVL